MKTTPPGGDSNFSNHHSMKEPADEKNASLPSIGNVAKLATDSNVCDSEPAVPEPVAVVTPAEATALMLSKPQRTAIIQLTSGSTRSAAAIAAGVTRATLYKWLNHDPAFQAAFNAWQKDLITTTQGQLLAASQEAVAVVLSAIRRGDARLAWKLLQSQGLIAPPNPGPTDVRELQLRQELDRKKKDVAERKEVNDLLHDDMLTLDMGDMPLG